MYIKIDEKKIWAKKIFWTPLSEKTGARNGKNAKNGQFQAKNGQNMTEKMSYSNFS